MSKQEPNRGRARGRGNRSRDVQPNVDQNLADRMERIRVRLPPEREPVVGAVGGVGAVRAVGGVGAVRAVAPAANVLHNTEPLCVTNKRGNSGRVVEFTANYFPLLSKTDWSLYQYRVDFEPEEDRTVIKKRLLRVHNEILKPYIFDGSVLFVSRKLPPDCLELFSIKPSDHSKVRITIKVAGDLSIGDHQYLQFFNILMRMCLDNLDLKLVGRNFFDPKSRVEIKEYNMDMWPGFIASIRQNESQVLMCAEISHKIMRRDTVLDCINACMSKSSSERDWKELFTKTITGCIVLTEYNNRTYRIHDVDFNATPLSTFQRKGQEPSTYMEYYKNKYNIFIRFSNQFMLVSKSKPREIRSGMTEFIYLVPELCRMTGLTDDMRTNHHLMRAVADHTRLTPQVRIDKLNNFSKILSENKQIASDLKLWNMQFSRSLVKFEGRILEPEDVRFFNNVKVNAGQDADWTRTMRNLKMSIAGELYRWAIVYVSHAEYDVQSFINVLTKSARTLNYSIPPPVTKVLRDDRISSYINALEDVIGRNNPQLIMCILPNNKSERYNAIKRKCCCDRSVLTQMVQAKNLKSKNLMSIASKIAIQINCKLGGTPWALTTNYEGLMVCGYDVCHDANDKSKSHSAVVTSINYTFSRYRSTVTRHEFGEELSNDLPLNIMKGAIAYFDLNGSYPDRIVIYRDGVGDGQIPYVLSHEVENIKGMLKQLYEGKLPQISFVIVTKRILTRIFYKNKNPPPGTIVDDCITSPEKYDFFLVSQSVRQGTVSPTSYHVIDDNSYLSPDEMQRLTYRMTHLYYNWSGTIRVPAPCQYAHKLAYLVSQSLNRPPNPGLNDLLYFL